MLLDLLMRNLVTLFMIPLFSFKLWSRRAFKDAETKFFWITVLSCLILVAEDILEGIASMDRSLRLWRILLSALGYNFRTTAAVGLLLVVVPPEKRQFRLWIPNLLLIPICLSAFFTDIAFGFDENYVFYRGPLNYVAFAVPIIYLLLILWNVIRNFSEKNGKEKYIPPTCALFCLAATAADATVGGSHLIEAIMISSIFFYIVLYSHDNRRDTLTGLLNRRAFYDDCINYQSSVTAVASLDMNGLKELNDDHGHLAGDQALISIGKCISDAVGRNIQAYRVGGDEFILLAFSGNAEKSPMR